MYNVRRMVTMNNSEHIRCKCSCVRKTRRRLCACVCRNNPITYLMLANIKQATINVTSDALSPTNSILRTECATCCAADYKWASGYGRGHARTQPVIRRHMSVYGVYPLPSKSGSPDLDVHTPAI